LGGNSEEIDEPGSDPKQRKNHHQPGPGSEMTVQPPSKEKAEGDGHWELDPDD
jgi:hypothetical protein